MIATPRIAMISALAQSPGPAMAAMGEVWPDARYHNLIRAYYERIANEVGA